MSVAQADKVKKTKCAASSRLLSCKTSVSVLAETSIQTAVCLQAMTQRFRLVHRICLFILNMWRIVIIIRSIDVLFF
ncbi:unnamed protein product [Parnassius mnemosyne]|uniref:Uncharacterized protein n=1 Tax=Parnassius mnemosyne TaxID=213953 RepID=A0AAV1L007_9NEOP